MKMLSNLGNLETRVVCGHYLAIPTCTSKLGLKLQALPSQFSRNVQHIHELKHNFRLVMKSRIQRDYINFVPFSGITSIFDVSQNAHATEIFAKYKSNESGS